MRNNLGVVRLRVLLSGAAQKLSASTDDAGRAIYTVPCDLVSSEKYALPMCGCNSEKPIPMLQCLHTLHKSSPPNTHTHTHTDTQTHAHTADMLHTVEHIGLPPTDCPTLAINNGQCTHTISSNCTANWYQEVDAYTEPLPVFCNQFYTEHYSMVSHHSYGPAYSNAVDSCIQGYTRPSIWPQHRQRRKICFWNPL